jgi:hypothetical protein
MSDMQSEPLRGRVRTQMAGGMIVHISGDVDHIRGVPQRCTVFWRMRPGNGMVKRLVETGNDV